MSIRRMLNTSTGNPSRRFATISAVVGQIRSALYRKPINNFITLVMCRTRLATAAFIRLLLEMLMFSIAVESRTRHDV